MAVGGRLPISAPSHAGHRPRPPTATPRAAIPMSLVIPYHPPDFPYHFLFGAKGGSPPDFFSLGVILKKFFLHLLKRTPHTHMTPHFFEMLGSRDFQGNDRGATGRANAHAPYRALHGIVATPGQFGYNGGVDMAIAPWAKAISQPGLSNCNTSRSCAERLVLQLMQQPSGVFPRMERMKWEFTSTLAT